MSIVMTDPFLFVPFVDAFTPDRESVNTFYSFSLFFIQFQKCLTNVTQRQIFLPRTSQPKHPADGIAAFQAARLLTALIPSPLGWAKLFRPFRPSKRWIAPTRICK